MRWTLAPFVLLLACTTPAPSDDDVDDDTGADDDDSTLGDDDDTSGDDDDSTPLPDELAMEGLPSFHSQRDNDWAGESVVITTDLQGDGIDDIVIGAPAGGEKEPGGAEGRVHIFFGRSEGWDGALSLDDADAILLGSPADDLGFHVVGLGDWDGDGLGDFAASAPNHAEGAGQAGRVWIVRGADLVVGSQAISELAVEVLPEATNSRLGFGLAGVRDVDGDGLDDLLVGAQTGAPGSPPNEGVSYLILGRSASADTLETGSANSKLRPGCATCFGSLAGQSLASAGDVDGDGRFDFLIGAPESRPSDGMAPPGRAYLVYGRAAWPSELLIEPDAPAEADGVSRFVGTLANGDFGLGLGAGDFDGDGFSDVLIGAPHGGDGASFAEGSLFIYLSEGARFPAVLGPAQADGSFQGTVQLHSVGSAVAAADIDGDGSDELVLGCPEGPGVPEDTLGRPGRVTQVDPADLLAMLDAGMDPDEIGFRTWLGTEAPQWLGESLSMGGDVDGDGIPDLLIGANKTSAQASRGGAAFLLPGSRW